MPEIEVVPSFSDLFDMIKETMISTDNNKCKYTDSGEFIFFKEEKEQE